MQTATLRTRTADTIDDAQYLYRSACPFTEQHTEATGVSTPSCKFAELHQSREQAAADLIRHMQSMHDLDELAALLVRHWPDSIVSLRLVPER